MILKFCRTVLFLAIINKNAAYLRSRIIGGQTAEIQEIPYQVSLHYFGIHTCGGSIISNNYIVTAAHCVEKGFSFLYSVHYGSSFSNKYGLSTRVLRIIMHQYYDKESSNYDIALIKLSSYIKFNTAVQPVLLPFQDEEFPVGTMAVVSGWGLVSENGKNSETLRKVTVPIMQQAICRSLYLKKGNVTNRMICAGYLGGVMDACQGDSGGPLVYKNTLLGIVSWGHGCARANYPGVYTKVSKFRNWISRNAGV